MAISSGQADGSHGFLMTGYRECQQDAAGGHSVSKRGGGTVCSNAAYSLCWGLAAKEEEE